MTVLRSDNHSLYVAQTSRDKLALLTCFPNGVTTSIMPEAAQSKYSIMILILSAK